MQSFKFEVPVNSHNQILKNICNSYTSDQIADFIMIGYYVQQSAKCNNVEQQTQIQTLINKLNELKNLPEILNQNKSQIVRESNQEILGKLNIIEAKEQSYAQNYNAVMSDFRKTLNQSVCGILETSTIKDLQKSVESLNSTLHIPTYKGNIGENKIQQELQARYPSLEIFDISGTGHKGDFYVIYNKVKIMFEIKNYKNTVPTTQISKFMEDLDNNDYSYGIFISIGSGIANFSEMTYQSSPKNKQAIIIPRADINGQAAIFAYESVKLLHAELNDVKVVDVIKLKANIKAQYNTLKQYQDSTEDQIEALDDYKKAAVKFVNNMKKTINTNRELIDTVISGLKLLR